MNLLDTGELFVEQPWTMKSLLFRAHYRAEVFDRNDVPVAVVRERSEVGLKRLWRVTSYSGWTSFHLVMVAANGRPLLNIRKPAGPRRRMHVATPEGRSIGTIKRVGSASQPRPTLLLHDANGQRLCAFGDVGRVHTGYGKRDGRRVRRDAIRINPAVAEPVRSLAVACAVALDIASGQGSNLMGVDGRGSVIFPSLG